MHKENSSGGGGLAVILQLPTKAILKEAVTFPDDGVLVEG